MIFICENADSDKYVDPKQECNLRTNRVSSGDLYRDTSSQNLPMPMPALGNTEGSGWIGSSQNHPRGISIRTDIGPVMGTLGEALSVAPARMLPILLVGA